MSGNTPHTQPHASALAAPTPAGDKPEGIGKRKLRVTSDQARVIFNSLGRGERRDPPQTRGRKLRRPFTNSPSEREQKVDRHGNPVSEIEALTEKHSTEFKQIVPVVADGLRRAVSHMKTVAPGSVPARYNLYDTSSVPTIAMEDYVQRIADNAFMSPASLIVAMIFVDRVLARHSDLSLTELNVYKLFFVACRIASKVVEVRTLSNKNFAPIGGVDLRHLNDLEAKFLIDIRFDVYVQPKEFVLYCNQVLQQCPIVATVSYVDRLRIVTSIQTKEDEAENAHVAPAKRQ